MSDGILIFVRKGNYAVLQTNDGLVISVLFPNFYKNSHFDVSKDFLLDIESLIKARDFESLDHLADDIRKNYSAYQSKEVAQVNMAGKKLIN
ncbi:hypothetical protein [Pantoea sp. S62]|uniref:hypothetical protein n=1 Tax=Pantoea sp. S62 TaxID=2769342 RepID=UPI0019114FE5|nr:hypothetical protein [Pantoea sp. S62]MBK5016474.1 hypothetical protein [Pantoea sp. S62]